jgi:di/tricarboxylate transporter
MAVLALVVLALLLFSSERILLKTSSFLVLTILAVGFEFFPYQVDGKILHAVDFFTGFGHEALVAVCALMIAGQALVRTGALEPVGRILSRLWRVSPNLSLLLTLLAGAVLSAFVNNTPIVVLLLPILISVSLRTKTQASKILMPMGLATLAGGMSTTIGTSTNLLVVSVAADMGMRRIGLFDFVLPAVVAGGIGILYLWLLAPRLLPVREPLLTDTSPRIFTAHLHIPEGSFCDGKTLSQAISKTDGAMKVNRIRRGHDSVILPLPDMILKAGDRLRLDDTPERLKGYEKDLGAALYSGGTPVDEEHPLTAEEQQIAEVAVVQGSPLVGETLRSIGFLEQYQLVTLALHRAGLTLVTLSSRVEDVVLRMGDVLLVQGSRVQIALLKRRGELLVLDATSDLPRTAKAPLALCIMAAIVFMAAFGILPIAISAVSGVLLMILTRCLRWHDATRSLSTSVIMVVVASLGLGAAMSKTGGAQYLAEFYVALTHGASPAVVLSGLILLMAMLTNVVSNNAAAVIGTPIAVNIAGQLGVSPEPFVLAVLFGVNMSYATPMAYQTNLLVMNAGGYTFGDFVRVGTPLTLLMWLAFSWLLPVLYGL